MFKNKNQGPKSNTYKSLNIVTFKISNRGMKYIFHATYIFIHDDRCPRLKS